MHDDIMHDGPKLISEDEICTMGFMLMTKYYAWWHNAWWNMMHWYVAISLHNKIKQKLSLLPTIFTIRLKSLLKITVFSLICTHIPGWFFHQLTEFLR
jgi:hypothetical protein